MTTLVFFSEEDMRIQSINFLGINQTNRQNQNKNQKYSTSSVPQEKLPYTYNNYNINFGARINRTPEDFYAQKFNIDNMPITVKEYLFEDFELPNNRVITRVPGGWVLTNAEKHMVFIPFDKEIVYQNLTKKG